MRRIYTHNNPMLVGFVKGKLESEGYTVYVKNEMAGGGAGELAPTDLWPELWLEDEADYTLAERLIQQINSTEEQRLWHCRLCGEHNNAAFEICWRCQGIPPVDFGQEG